jgi:hypothetical protein
LWSQSLPVARFLRRAVVVTVEVNARRHLASAYPCLLLRFIARAIGVGDGRGTVLCLDRRGYALDRQLSPHVMGRLARAEEDALPCNHAIDGFPGLGGKRSCALDPGREPLELGNVLVAAIGMTEGKRGEPDR